MACIYFTRAILELEDIGSYLACHTHNLRYNRNLLVEKQAYRGASIAEIGERVAKLFSGDKQRTIVNGTPSSTNSASPESPCVAACICAMFTGRIACAFALYSLHSPHPHHLNFGTRPFAKNQTVRTRSPPGLPYPPGDCWER